MYMSLVKQSLIKGSCCGLICFMFPHSQSPANEV